MDRPHILYNQRTKKFVCWLKIMNRDKTQTETVLTADHILGPYTKVREGLRPLGMSAGDFDLAVAPDGKAYYYFERSIRRPSAPTSPTTTPTSPATTAPTSPMPARPMCGRPRPTSAARASTTCHQRHHGLFAQPLGGGHSRHLARPLHRAGGPPPHRPQPHLLPLPDFVSVPGGGQKGFVHRRGGPLVPPGHGRAYDFTREMFEYLFQAGGRKSPPWRRGTASSALPGTGSGTPPSRTTFWLPFRFEGDRPYLDWHDEWRIEDYE